jgi:hypothetical protein
VPGLSSISGGTVSALNPQYARPIGNADTIVNALAPFPSAGARAAVQGAAETGFFSYNEPSCAGAGINPDTSTALLTVGAAGASGIPVVGGIIAKALSIFGAHHAAAVKTEQATLCQEVPKANAFLRGIDLAVSQGQIDPDTAASALEQGYAAWRAEVGAILKDSGGQCNAACVYEKCFRAAIEKRKQDYAWITSQNRAGAQGVSGVVSGVLDTVGKAVSDVLTPGSASVFASPATANASVLGQAGLTPARQSVLAGVLVVGGLLAVVLFVNLIGGRK